MKNIKNIFGGLIFGILFFVGSFALLWWNEGNNARNIATAGYMKKHALQIDVNRAEESNNGKLVAIKGSVVTNSTLKDENVTLLNTLVLERTVEMYQWNEESYEDSNGNKRYEYTKEWSSSKIDSKNFNNRQYSNPDFPVTSAKFYADSAKLGVFDLTEKQISKIAPEKDLYDLPQNAKYSVENGKYYSGKNLQSPEIGDILISYTYAPSGTNISLIGKQQSNQITSFNYKGRENHVQYNGSFDKDEIIDKYKHENSILTNVLRFTGWLLMFIGLKLLVSPIEAIFGFIPILGKVVESVSSFIILLISLILSLITIAIAWFAFRPFVSLILIAISVGISVLIKQNLQKKPELSEKPME